MIDNRRLEKMIASAMEVIYQDEKNHYKEAAREAARVVQNKQDLARMKEAVREVSLQRVYMHNEMSRKLGRCLIAAILRASDDCSAGDCLGWRCEERNPAVG